ncbi:MAG: hypothetical protein EXS35_09225 [Pedosphaera sp.]|nr:hypothetical protein [Pedosphaera sp.]
MSTPVLNGVVVPARQRGERFGHDVGILDFAVPLAPLANQSPVLRRRLWFVEKEIVGQKHFGPERLDAEAELAHGDAGRGAGLEIIPDVIEARSFQPAVAGGCAPVIDDVIAEIEEHARCVLVASGAGVARVVVRIDTVMNAERAAIRPQQRPVPVLALGMKTAVEALVNQTPLHGHVAHTGAVQRAVLVHGPTDRAMIENDIVRAGNVKRAEFGARFIAQPEADVTNDDVVRFDARRVARDANAVARYGLAGDGEEGFAHDEDRFQKNRAGSFEKDLARTFRGDDLAQTAGDGRFAFRGIIVLQRGDEENLAAAPTGCERAEALCAGKCGEIFSRAINRLNKADRECH